MSAHLAVKQEAQSEPTVHLTIVEAADHPAAEPPEEAIRLRSQQIWESEGCPEGLADLHWERARAELAEQMAKMTNRHPTTPVDDEPIEEVVIEPTAAPTPALCDVQDHASPKADTDIPQRDRIPVRSAIPVVPSIICAGLAFQGELESPGDLQFDGSLDGTIRSAGLHIGEQATIRGDVIADELTVRGAVNGRIFARKILLCTGCRVQGEVHYGALTIETGAGLDAAFRDWNEAL